MNCYVKITWGAILCMIIIELMVDCQNTQYQFKRYTYKKKRDVCISVQFKKFTYVTFKVSMFFLKYYWNVHFLKYF